MWFLLAHGAGAPSSSAWMVRYSARLEAIAPVHTFDYQYMSLGKKRPDAHLQLLATHRAALQEGQQRFPERRPVLIGKSMGGRIGCHLALEESVLGCICLGYPLVGMGKSPSLRDQVLLDLAVPALFVQGTRDKLCPLDRLKDVLTRRPSRSELLIIESGDHSLQATQAHLKSSGQTQDQIELAIFERVGAFVDSLLD